MGYLWGSLTKRGQWTLPFNTQIPQASGLFLGFAGLVAQDTVHGFFFLTWGGGRENWKRSRAETFSGIQQGQDRASVDSSEWGSQSKHMSKVLVWGDSESNI